MSAAFATMHTSSNGFTSCAAGTSARADMLIVDAVLCAVSIIAFIRLCALVILGS